MKPTSLFYPYDSVLECLQVILTRKGCTILSVNENEGIIKAHCKKNFLFQKHKDLEIKIGKIDRNITDVTLWVNANLNIYEKPVTEDECAEVKLLHTINKYF